MDHIDIPTKQRDPWNKAKLVGQKAPLNSRRSGRYASAYNSPFGFAISPFLIWQSTASSGPATWSN